MKTINYNVEYKVYPLTVAENDAIQVCSPDSMFNALKDDYNAIQEEIYLLLFDVRNRITKKIMLVKGAYNSVMVTPKDIFTQVLLDGKTKFAIAHNHPSGEVTPNNEDLLFTRRIIETSKIMGLEILDHIVYSDGDFHSMRQKDDLWD